MNKKLSSNSIVEESWFGTIFTTIGAGGFFFLGMMLPLVGPAAVNTNHYTKNFLSFLVVLLIVLFCSFLGFVSKRIRSKKLKEPFPFVSLGLTCLYVFMLIFLLLGLFKI